MNDASNIQASRLKLRHWAPSPKSLLMTPVLLVFLFLFVIPLAWLTYLSLGGDSASEGLGLGNFETLIGSSSFIETLLKTIKIAAIVTAVDLVIGYPVAYAIATTNRPRVASLLYLVVLAPLLISLTVRTLGWVILLGPSGPIVKVIQALGATPPTLLYNQFGVIVGMSHVLLPLMIIPIAASLQGVDKDLEGAASTLGASRMYTLRRVVLPLSAPGMAAGSLIVFSLTMSGYETPVILGGPEAGQLMAAYITGQATQFANIAVASAAAIIFLIAIVPFVVINQRVERRLGRYE